MTEDLRLYSRQPRLPVDVISPQHVTLHAELEAWGRWCRERYQPGTCDSVEGNYQESSGREAKAPVITLPENPQHRALDRVVRYMRMHMPQHGEGLKLFYVGVLRKLRARKGRPISAWGLRYEPCDPKRICIVLHLKFEDFGGFMFYSRSAVLNLLRREGEVTTSPTSS